MQTKSSQKICSQAGFARFATTACAISTVNGQWPSSHEFQNQAESCAGCSMRPAGLLIHQRFDYPLIIPHRISARMDAITYAVVFSGGVMEGFAPVSVKAHIAKMLKVDAAKMANLFSGKPVVIKRTPDKTEALRYGHALRKIGADVSIKVLKSVPAKPAASDAAPASAPQRQNSLTNTFPEFSLAPNDGNLFDPAPARDPVQVDTSKIALAENEHSPLAPPRKQTPVNVDISGLSVLENDGSPLVPAANAVAKLPAPNFEIDEPGTILDTSQDDRPKISPDTSGLSLAFPGSDLLNSEERKPEQARVKPDISRLKLVARFDT